MSDDTDKIDPDYHIDAELRPDIEILNEIFDSVEKIEFYIKALWITVLALIVLLIIR